MMPSKHECAIDQIEDMYIRQCLENEALLKIVGEIEYQLNEIEKQNEALLSWLNEQKKCCEASALIIMEKPHTTFNDLNQVQERQRLILTMIKGLQGELPIYSSYN